MDAHAHLLSLGWAGTGYALDARPYKQKGHQGLAYDPKAVRSTGEGLVKPLLISHRAGKLGIGSKKAHEPASGNQWWLKGFESALNNIGKSESERSSVSGTATPELWSQNGKHLGLYSFFIKGQQMEGTMGEDEAARGKKRKSDVLDEDKVEGLVYRRKRESTSEFEKVGTFIRARDKVANQRVREPKAGATEDFERIGEFFAQKDKDAKTRARSSDKNRIQVLPLQTTEEDITAKDSIETKEQRKERRRKRRENRMLIEGPTGTSEVSKAANVDDGVGKKKKKRDKVK